MESRIAVFKGKSIRKTIFNNKWWFSIIDVMEVLTGSQRPRKYWNDLKKKLLSEGYAQLSEKIGQLKLPSADGKLYETDCANTGEELGTDYENVKMIGSFRPQFLF